MNVLVNFGKDDGVISHSFTHMPETKQILEWNSGTFIVEATGFVDRGGEMVPAIWVKSVTLHSRWSGD